MKILFLADMVFEDNPGGSRVVARELARGLTERGHEVTFLVRSTPGSGSSDTNLGGSRIVRYGAPVGARGYIRAGQDACARLLAEHTYDIVHTHFAYGGVGPLRAIPSSVPRVRTFHGPWDEEGWIEDTCQAGVIRRIKAQFKRRLRHQIERRSLAESAKVLTLSRCFRDMASSRYGVREQQQQIIPGGTDPAAFTPLPDPVLDKAPLRRELGLPKDQQILFSVRRLAPRMGLDKLIQAMPKIIARCPDARLVIGGKGPEEARLRQLIQRLSLEAHVRLLGFIPPDKLPSYYQAADLFVLPTLALEGFGLVTAEALACGLPVIGTPIGATPELLTPLDPRLVAQSAEPDALAEAVTGFLQSAWRNALTPQRLHDYVLQNYTWDRHVARTEQVYQELLKPL